MSNEIDVMYRLIWNTNGWRAPSGQFEEAEDTFGSKHGYGHEEWNFRKEDAVDGYVYGYVRKRPARLLEKKSKFRIVFYSINPSSDWFLVGEYAEAEIIDENDPIKVDKYFEQNGIYDKRTNHLIPITSEFQNFDGHDFTKLRLSKRKEIIRNDLKTAIQNGDYILKCPVDKVEAYPGAIPIESPLLDELYRGGTRYGIPFYPSSSIETEPTVQAQSAKQDARLVEGSYWRLSPKKRREIEMKHNSMSNEFANWLKEQGYTSVRQEKDRVDTEFESGDNLCRAELKICGDGKPLWSIREAIGQLLEYNLYGHRSPADYWFIVLNEKPHKWDFDFVETMRDSYDLPVWLGWQEDHKFSLEKSP
ncbi:MAG: hypothetical protein ACOC38_12250 [Promethearchaeia archaeon]